MSEELTSLEIRIDNLTEKETTDLIEAAKKIAIKHKVEINYHITNNKPSKEE